MIFDFSKFVIEVDINKTKKFYDESIESPCSCSCRNCCNYMLAIDSFPKEVFNFFEKLCIDIRKSPEIYGIGEPKNGIFLYGGFYHLCGRIISCPDSWINREIPIIVSEDCYTITDDYYVWFKDEAYLLEEKIPMPAIQMEINFNIPWKLDEEFRR